ncbi:division plane positioning ATPase MipZ [Deefgea sp. CFH1-16]|uniref:nucleotide-binding protein n=1 Tax=Deefgea sp. CFH1-16 TaxID=2675457 RepID=UPI0015F3D0AC|nr:division plane positioning ATPase MipZ [Deefgea sp. CFH1-16]MBM5575792.1 AAA family ATPase [Deefgea sp. CFH1-16]
MMEQNQIQRRCILIGNEKGGVGKSTLTRSLAVACALAGHDLAVVDADKQGSLTLWLDERKEADQQPYIPGYRLAGRCGTEIIALGKKYQTLLVDVAGRDSVELREAAIVADLWLIPTSVDPDDVDALATALTIIRNTELATGSKPNARLLINKCSTSLFDQDANSLIDALDSDAWREVYEAMPPMLSRISNRKAFPKSRSDGQGVIEYAQRKGASKSDQSAAAEIIALYEEIFGEPFKIAGATA